MVQVAVRLGCKSIEVPHPQHWPLLQENGLVCACAGIDMSPDLPFVKGMNNPQFQPRVIRATRDAIDVCAQFSFPNVIAFTGYSAQSPDGPRSPHVSPDEGLKNCVAGFKKVVGHAEKHAVNICLEMLNTRDDTHPMKGHPGYQGNDTEYCMEIIEQVGSPRMKLLFDVYHVEIMNVTSSGAYANTEISSGTCIRPAIPAGANWMKAKKSSIRP